LHRLVCQPLPATPAFLEPPSDHLAQIPVRRSRSRSAGRRLHRLGRVGRDLQPGAPQVAQPSHRVTPREAAPLGASRVTSRVEPPAPQAYPDVIDRLLRAFASSSARSPARMRSGVGGQPLISRSTGSRVPTPPAMA